VDFVFKLLGKFYLLSSKEDSYYKDYIELITQKNILTISH
jgi:hypothetical protein